VPHNWNRRKISCTATVLHLYGPLYPGLGQI